MPPSNVQRPRDTSATAPKSEFCGSADERASFGSAFREQRKRSTGWPFVPGIVPTSTSWMSDDAHASGMPPGAGTNGICPRPGAEVTVSARPNTCWFDTAATLIASGAVLGEPTEPRPKRSRSLPAEMTGTTPARATFAITSTIASEAGSPCGPPPEKLMTSIPSVTAASNAAAISGVFAEQQSSGKIGLGRLNTR